MNIGDGNCAFCGMEKETVLHLFSECDFIKPLWVNLQIDVRNVLSSHSNDVVSSKNIILGTGNAYIDIVILYAKWTIWKVRNNVVFENVWLSEEDFFRKIKSSVNSHIQFINMLDVHEQLPLL